MSKGSAHREALDKSLNFFTDPNSYAPLSLTRRYKRIVGCIDPRDEDCDDLKVIAQTPGGAIGEGHDSANSLSILRNELVPIPVGLKRDAETRRISDVVDAHYDCRFLSGLVTILEEETSPSDFTKDGLERWARLYGRWGVVKPLMGKIIDAAARQKEYLENNGGTETYIPIVKDLYYGDNVRRMVGKNRAGIYVINHHPLVGLNRNAKHRVYGLEIQGYHDSLSAMVDNLGHRRMGRRERSLRLASLLLRSAATRTVLGQAHENTVYLEVFPTDEGLEVKELTAA